MHILPKTSPSPTAQCSPRPTTIRSGLTGATAPNSQFQSQFQAQGADLMRLGDDGAIMSAGNKVGQVDTDFNFTLEVGGFTIQGNLLELLVQSMVEEMMTELTGVDFTGAAGGDQFSIDGRGYEVQPSHETPLSHPTTGWPMTGGGQSSGGGSWNTGGGTPVISGGTSAGGTRNTGEARVTGGTPTGDATVSGGPTVTGATSAHSGSTAAQNATLPIWPSGWGTSTRELYDGIMANDRTSIEQKRASLERFKSFQQEMFGGPAPTFNGNEGTGFIQNMFGTGAIHNEQYYSQARAQKSEVTQAYQRLLGREPTSHELKQLMYGSPNLTANESLFASRMASVTTASLQAFAQEVGRNPNLRDQERGVGDRLSDKEVADGVNEYLRGNPNATEAQIRQVAKSQFGISDSQLDRVKANFFSAPAPTRPTAPTPTAPTPTAPAARTYTDQEVADGVRAYLRTNPNATEAQIRQVAQSQFGLSNAQLDRVKANFFPPAPTPTTAPVAPTPTAPVAPTPVTYTDAQVADGVREYLRTNPNATEAQIRQVAQSQFGISTAQLDRVKQTYFS
ncbi:MAG: hypothetical protein Q8L14_40005 [Myxococcales bacterium]|nr:hypothetical protein [Myxococcales bacterium]